VLPHVSRLLQDDTHRLIPSVAHIADGEDAGNIGLEQERIAVERPALRTLPEGLDRCYTLRALSVGHDSLEHPVPA